MTRRLREIAYPLALDPPVAGAAVVAESAGAWRLVMFPGTPARRYLFERILRLAPDWLEAVLVMRPGFGRDHRQPYTDFADQIAAARPFLEDGRKVVTLGVSYGGELAIKAALDFPDIVRGVVAVAALITEPRGWVRPFLDLGATPAVNAALPRSLRHAHAEVAARRTQIEPLLARLGAYRGPATILHGDLDHLVALSDAAALRARFAPDADVIVERVRGGSHFLELQTPRRVLRAVEDVIRRAEGRDGRDAHQGSSQSRAGDGEPA